MYGILSDVDIRLMEYGLDHIHEEFKDDEFLHVLEIGVCHGDTARGINEYVTKRLGRKISYFGIDSERDKKIEPPFKDAQLVIGDSTVVYNQLPNNFHFIFIDGCHCINHVMLDFLHYGLKLRKGGVLLFHDTGETAKTKDDYQGHGPTDTRDFYIAASRAIDVLQQHGALLNKQWQLLQKDYDPNYPAGGISIYKKLF